MSKTLRNIHDIVAAFGGYDELAKWAGYEHASGAANWLSRGIPPAYHMRLSLEARRRGYILDPESVFGLEPDDAATFRAVFSEPCINTAA